MAETTAPVPAGSPRMIGKSYAEALTGSPLPRLKSDRVTRDVSLETRVTNDKLSTRDESIANDGNNETNQMHAPTTKRPSTNKNKRTRWTKDEQIELFRCYCASIRLKLTASKGTFEIWQKRNPTSRSNMTPNTLETQRR